MPLVVLTAFVCRRVEPQASSKLFIVHGKACRKGEQHPTCTHDNDFTDPAGKLYSIDIQAILGDDFRVRKHRSGIYTMLRYIYLYLCLSLLGCHPRL